MLRGYVMLSCSVVLLALFAGAQGRAVNISNTWVLPEEGFPVFYRYFRDRISWYEADAVCQFHHANLVTVDTTAQYDAVRAYLKELDISSAVWVGLIRSNPDGDFTWTDYRGLSGEGYWSSAPDERAAPLCAAADPAADYRWEARACGGPTVASFICELPVPQWALGNEGCMVRALPALTALYLPESAAVQLTADCGLAGVKRVQCTGNVKREDLLRDLSCADENESSSSSVTSVGTMWPLTTDTAFIDQETTSDTTTEENITTEHEGYVSESSLVKATSVLYNTEGSDKSPITPQTTVNQVNKVFSPKIIDLDLIHNNNLQSNDIPKLGNNDNFLSFEQNEKLEDEKHMHHKMMHDELALHGNFETIFTQPTDHFVPPLVMAKAKISDDMTVLSLAEKHAQQLAEQRFAKHKVLDEHKDHQNFEENKTVPKSTTEEPNKVVIIDKPLGMTIEPLKNKDNEKKEIYKYSLPKKYKEKYNDPKTKTFKDNKLLKIDKPTETSTRTESTKKLIETTILPFTESPKNMSEGESPIEITVILNEPDEKHENQSHKSNYSGDIANLGVIRNNNKPEKSTSTEKITTDRTLVTSPKALTETVAGVTMTHEVIKVTIINEDHSSQTPTVFEITTRVPEFKDSMSTDPKTKSSTTELTTKSFALTDDIATNTIVNKVTNSSVVVSATTTIPDVTTLSVIEHTATPGAKTSKADTISDKSTVRMFTTEGTLATKIEVKINSTTPTQTNITDHVENNTEVYTTMHVFYDTTKDKSELFNSTDIHENYFERNFTDTSEDIDDLNSPLLSAANEPIHRPNRSRRPQPPLNRINKFNPFRILG